jgi:DNA-binding NtrC family response regulator
MQTQQSGMRVLVVDDEEAVLRVHAQALAKSGYQVETAGDGNAAVRVLGQISFDVILSDIDMPGMDGIDLLERVRTRDLDVPVVLITGNPSAETATRAVKHGALRYLVKPVELGLLVKCSSVSQLRRPTTSSRIMAMCAAGPPNAVAPSLRKSRASSDKGVVVRGSVGTASLSVIAGPDPR